MGLGGIMVSLLAGVPLARAEGAGYSKLPAGDKGQASPFEMRVVKYDGSTNGQLLVEVRNTSNKTATFNAEGLYFVPNGDPDKAPQRLGAVGPYQQKTEKGWERKDNLALQPGQSAKLMLDVYCIDSHRSSPSSANTFSVGKTKMPKSLTRSIDRDARKSAKEAGGFAAPAAKGAVQREVWKNRDKDWIKLDGEGAQEAGK
jgi:hypothetical protein